MPLPYKCFAVGIYLCRSSSSSSSSSSSPTNFNNPNRSHTTLNFLAFHFPEEDFEIWDTIDGENKKDLTIRRRRWNKLGRLSHCAH